MNIDDYIVHCETVSGLNKDEILSKLDEHQFCIIRGLVKPAELQKGMTLLHAYVEETDDRACTGERPDEVRDYFMKMSIGQGNHSGHDINRGRFMRTVYLPLDKSDKFNLLGIFKDVARVRNLLMSKDLDFAVDKAQEGFWTAARVHHFPVGGGHMVLHKDTLAPQLLDEANYDYFQPILVMSKKFEDYEKGGGVAVIDDQLVEYEDFCAFGDIAIYNVNTIHGVNEVDLHRPFVQRSSAGRYSGLVTLYKEM